ncbi:MAG: hypothetical protein NC311_14065 [Muribaculaceae bacterium]|nr:hypothetical protein [Muribaculaceae bacterium]
MKSKSLFWRAMQICMAAMMVCLCFACSEDEPAPTPTPDEPKNGEVSFNVELPGGSGSGTASSPVIVTSGEALNMAVSQKSSYTDPTGKVYTCEPLATISLSAQLDTVYAKDLTSLTSVKDGSDVKSSTSGTNPVNHKTLQKFNVGGQEIAFDLMHEVFTITNSVNEKIEMPYIKVNQAKLGNANATEETPQGRAAAVVSAVTVRPLAMSRAQTITDSTMYEVNVRLNLTLESVHSKENSTQTVEFSVNYVGVVETTTTLEDPKSDLSYIWDVKSGTNSSSSPFVQEGRNPMEIWMVQTSVYTDEYTNKFTCEPKAKIIVTTPQDTVWATSVEDLRKLAETADNVGENTSAKQIFTVGDKQVSVDWSYELGQTLNDKNVVMPYYKLSPAKLKNVSMKEVDGANTATSEKNIAAYEITATFAQTATADGFAGDFPQSFDIEYVVKYIGAVEVSIVDVVYTKGYEWLEAHDNLALRANVTITREIVYSNGKRETEKYQSANYMFTLTGASSNPYGRSGYLEIPLSDGECLSFLNNRETNFYDDVTAIYTTKTGVPNLNKLSHRVYADGFYEPFGEEYRSLYRKEYSEQAFGEDNHEEGWYVRWAVHNRIVSLMYEDYDEVDYGIRRYILDTGHYDLFYYFKDTDTVVDFADKQPERSYSFTEESAQIAEGPARVFKHECKVRYLERDFYIATVDTVYQNK